ncbi:hypothetical protein AVV30_gp015 [Vibrio phage phi 1]|uniref:Uncharacterized protein n=1 Tax=Vibrio phage phi 1 TaxID=1589297 RepID=A0A0B5H8I0_9CAUD|nr:hypothetical protein AVV30_gp015 [Vibrio phage phi 1]AJF40673.1 hypothetical protein SBVP1_0015 [Vibrio phage phi 1]
MLLIETYKNTQEKDNPTIWFNRGFFIGYIQLDNGFWSNSYTDVAFKKWLRTGVFVRLTQKSTIADLIN